MNDLYISAARLNTRVFHEARYCQQSWNVTLYRFRKARERNVVLLSFATRIPLINFYRILSSIRISLYYWYSLASRFIYLCYRVVPRVFAQDDPRPVIESDRAKNIFQIYKQQQQPVRGFCSGGVTVNRSRSRGTSSGWSTSRAIAPGE